MMRLNTGDVSEDDSRAFNWANDETQALRDLTPAIRAHVADVMASG